MDSNDKIQASYDEVKSLLAQNASGNTLSIAYDSLDQETQVQLRQAIGEVLHKRINALSVILTGNNQEFVVW